MHHRSISRTVLIFASACSLGIGIADATAAAEFAGSVVTQTNVTNAAGALGGFATSEGGYAIDPFFPAYPQTTPTPVLATVASGGALTLEFASPVTLSSQTYLGIYSSVGLSNTVTTMGSQPATSPLSAPGSIASDFGQISLSTPSYARISVSADGTHFVPLNGGLPILFDNPTNAYTDVSDTVSLGGTTFVDPVPGTHLAAATPFTGNISDFAGQTESQILRTLNGSAGGTWLNLGGIASSSINYVKYVKFSVPAGESAYINAVAISDPALPVPEPAALTLLAIPAILGLYRRRRASLDCISR